MRINQIRIFFWQKRPKTTSMFIEAKYFDVSSKTTEGTKDAFFYGS